MPHKAMGVQSIKINQSILLETGNINAIESLKSRMVSLDILETYLKKIAINESN
jgi:hypothetical protein